MSGKSTIRLETESGSSRKRGEPQETVLSVQGRQRDLDKARNPGATARYFAILERVALSPEPVDVLDLIADLSLPKATAYRLVDWLIIQGYLSREPGRKRLVVGAKLKSLAFGTLSSSMRNDTAHLVLRQLVRSVKETCNMGTVINGEVVYIDRVESEDWPLRLQYFSGSRVPIHCTAIGKLFLAVGPQARNPGFLERLDLPRFTRHTITSRNALQEELRSIRREQASFDREEFLDGVVCVAVPIMNGDGNMFAALAIQAPSARMSVQTARKHVPALRTAAADLASSYD